MNAFRLPDLGEGLPEAEIVEWHVKVGDLVKADQLLVSMETAKAVVDVPSPVAGVITALCGEVGDVIRTGAVLVEFAEEQQPAVLGAEHAQSAPAHSASASDAGTVVGRIDPAARAPVQQDEFWLSGQGSASGAVTGQSGILAMPRVRLLAKELGVELGDIAGSGPGGQLLEQDVYHAVEQQEGHFERLSGARKAMSDAMSDAFAQVALVTLQDVADISHWPEKTDVTVRLLQALVKACNTEPALNAWYHGRLQTRRLHQRLHIGIAVDSEHGLYVPVLEDVAAKSGQTLRNELDLLVEQVRQRRMPKQTQAATLTLSNFGAIAGRFATPVVTPPQVAIVGVGRQYTEPKQTAAGWQPGRYLPLSLSFDHRACTGGEAARFLQAMIDALTVI